MCPAAQEEARSLQVFLSVAPRDVRAALQYHNRLAHVAYRIGENARLLRQNLLQCRGGLLSLSDCQCPPIPRPEPLCREILQECNLRGYGGVLADFEGQASPEKLALLERLCAALSRSGRRLFLPEALASQVPGSTAVICTAISGGTLQQRLEEAVRRFGRSQTALDVERLAMDFSLPAPSGSGVPLEPEALASLLRERDPATFYSRDLCARYFTYAQDGRTHFVLFDDAETIRQKLRIGREMGLCAAFLMYPEVKDLLPAIFPRPPGADKARG